MVTFFFKHSLCAVFPILSLFWESLIKSVSFSYHSSIVFSHKIPVSSSLIHCLNAPKFEAIVGTLQSAASTHLFSDFASLNIEYSRGARLISILAIISGKDCQGTKGEEIIRFSKGF